MQRTRCQPDPGGLGSIMRVTTHAPDHHTSASGCSSSPGSGIQEPRIRPASGMPRIGASCICHSTCATLHGASHRTHTTDPRGSRICTRTQDRLSSSSLGLFLDLLRDAIDRPIARQAVHPWSLHPAYALDQSHAPPSAHPLGCRLLRPARGIFEVLAGESLTVSPAHTK